MTPPLSLPEASSAVPPASSSFQWPTSVASRGSTAGAAGPTAESTGAAASVGGLRSAFISASVGGNGRVALTAAQATENPFDSVRRRTLLSPAVAYLGSAIGTHSQRLGSLGPPCISCLCLR